MRNFRELINILLPPRCYICNAGILTDKFSNICDNCLNDLKKMVFPHPREISYERYRIKYFSTYTGKTKRLIHLLKFQKHRDLGPVFKEIFSVILNGIVKENDPDIISYIPAHYLKKYLIRGFDQNEFLLKYLLEEKHLDLIKRIIRRKRYTRPLYNLSLQERRAQLEGAFYACRYCIMDKRILLFDDIYTSGTTIGEALKTISSHQPEQVDIISLCHGY